MEGELLIDLDESAKRSLEGEMNLLGSPNLSTKQVEALLDYSNFLECAPGMNHNSMSNNEAKCLLYSDPAELMSPFRCSTKRITQSVESVCFINSDPTAVMSPLGNPTKNSAQGVKMDVFIKSDPTGLMSPFGCPTNGSAKNFNLVSLPDSDPSKLMSPFGLPTKGSAQSVKSELAPQNHQVPTGDLLQVQEEPKLPDDMFDIVVLEKKQSEVVIKNENPLTEKMYKLLIPSIPSIGSGESNISSDGTINRGFSEMSSNIGSNDLFPAPDDSVFEEALALSEEFSKLAVKAPRSPFEAIENEECDIVYNCPDWDEDEMENIELQPNHDEMKKLLEKSFIEDEVSQKGINESDHKYNSSLALSEILGTSQLNETPTSFSTSSSSPISPLPLSTHRVDRMRLKATEVIRAPLSFAPLKVNASSRSAPPAKGGPMKAFLPLGQMIKSKTLSPTVINSAKSKGTPKVKVTASSPTTKEGNSRIQMMSSTPKMCAPYIVPSQGSSVRKNTGKGLVGSNRQSLGGGSKVHPEVSSTPPRPRASSFGKGQQIGKMGASVRAVAVSGIKKTSGQSPMPKNRFSTSCAAIKTTAVVRSSSTGNLPLTPSLKKVNSTPQLPGFQSQLKRSNSLSTKLPQRSSGPPLANSMNSPAKQSTPLHKLMSKFRRNSVSKGMKENISPI